MQAVMKATDFASQLLCPLPQTWTCDQATQEGDSTVSMRRRLPTLLIGTGSSGLWWVVLNTVEGMVGQA